MHLALRLGLVGCVYTHCRSPKPIQEGKEKEAEAEEEEIALDEATQQLLREEEEVRHGPSFLHYNVFRHIHTYTHTTHALQNHTTKSGADGAAADQPQRLPAPGGG